MVRNKGGNLKGKNRPLGMELFEVLPVILGGNPIDPGNKVWLNRYQHFEAVRYWNNVISKLRKEQSGAPPVS